MEQETKIDSVMNLLQAMNKEFQSLSERLNKVEKVQGPQTATEQVARFTGKESEKEEPKDQTLQEMILHPRHRKIVDEVLGEQFEAWETYEDTNTTRFMFHVKVPIELSSIPKEEKSKGRSLDIRSKAIPQALGENGVREWCKLIRNNLNRYYTQNALPSPFSNAV